MTKQFKYPEGVAVIRGNDRSIQMCIDNIKLTNNIEYCDFRTIDYVEYLKRLKPELDAFDLQYFYSQGDYDKDVYRLYVEDIANIIKRNAIDVLIVNDDEYIGKIMAEHDIWTRNIVNLASINYFIKLISKISDLKNNVDEYEY